MTEHRGASDARVGWGVPWIPIAVYALVAIACLYGALVGIAPLSLLQALGLVAAFGALFAVELLAARLRPNVGVTAVLIALRAVLYVGIAFLDGTGLSRALFVLVPFLVTLAFGRVWGMLSGVVGVAVIVALISTGGSDWYRNADAVSDMLMFVLGVVIAITMAESVGRERAAALRLAELSAAAERGRLARDVHDSLGHHLTASSIQLEKAAAFAGRDEDQSRAALDEARAAVKAALADVRTSVGSIRAGSNLHAELTRLVERARVDGVDVRLHLSGELAALAPGASDALFRTAQEALTNARRHGHANRIRLELVRDARGTRLQVTDDGHGFTPSEDAPGYGLLGMRERAALVGGTLNIESEPGEGTRLTLSLPRGAA